MLFRPHDFNYLWDTIQRFVDFNIIVDTSKSADKLSSVQIFTLAKHVKQLYVRVTICSELVSNYLRRRRPSKQILLGANSIPPFYFVQKCDVLAWWLV